MIFLIFPLKYIKWWKKIAFCIAAWNNNNSLASFSRRDMMDILAPFCQQLLRFIIQLESTFIHIVNCRLFIRQIIPVALATDTFSALRILGVVFLSIKKWKQPRPFTTLNLFGNIISDASSNSRFLTFLRVGENPHTWSFPMWETSFFFFFRFFSKVTLRPTTNCYNVVGSHSSSNCAFWNTSFPRCLSYCIFSFWISLTASKI